jgi:hypothetical protein
VLCVSGVSDAKATTGLRNSMAEMITFIVMF